MGSRRPYTALPNAKVRRDECDKVQRRVQPEEPFGLELGHTVPAASSGGDRTLGVLEYQGGSPPIVCLCCARALPRSTCGKQSPGGRTNANTGARWLAPATPWATHRIICSLVPDTPTVTLGSPSTSRRSRRGCVRSQRTERSARARPSARRTRSARCAKRTLRQRVWPKRRQRAAPDFSNQPLRTGRDAIPGPCGQKKLVATCAHVRACGCCCCCCCCCWWWRGGGGGVGGGCQTPRCAPRMPALHAGTTTSTASPCFSVSRRLMWAKSTCVPWKPAGRSGASRPTL